MSALFQFLENNSLIVWMVSSPSILAYPTVLATHTIGMAFLVGTTTALSLRTLGFAHDLPLAPMDRFFPVAFVGFWLSLLSGLLLVAGEASRFLTMPTFYIKLGGIAGALISVRLLRIVVFRNASDRVPPVGKALAGATIFCWTVAVLAGRSTAYLPSTGWKTTGVFVIVAAVLLLAGTVVVRLSNRPSRVGDPGTVPTK